MSTVAQLGTQEHEQACVDATRVALADELRAAGTRVLYVELKGAHPDTEVCVTVQHGPQRGHHATSRRFRVWDDGGLVASPEAFATSAAAWVAAI